MCIINCSGAEFTSALHYAHNMFWMGSIVLITLSLSILVQVDEALVLVKQSQGLRKCKELAQVHAEKAIQAISVLEPSPARDSLIALACKVVTRTY